MGTTTTYKSEHVERLLEKAGDIACELDERMFPEKDDVQELFSIIEDVKKTSSSLTVTNCTIHPPGRWVYVEDIEALLDAFERIAGSWKTTALNRMRKAMEPFQDKLPEYTREGKVAKDLAVEDGKYGDDLASLTDEEWKRYRRLAKRAMQVACKDKASR